MNWSCGLLLILLVLVQACQSYNPDTNIEAAYHPVANESREDMEAYIDEVLKKMYPKIGEYKLKIDEKGYSTRFYMGGNHFHVKSEGLLPKPIRLCSLF